MAFAANYPIAVAPAMGHNFFFTFTVVVAGGTPWTVALGAVAIAGVAFLGCGNDEARLPALDVSRLVQRVDDVRALHLFLRIVATYAVLRAEEGRQRHRPHFLLGDLAVALERFVGKAVIVDLRDSGPSRPIDAPLLSRTLRHPIEDRARGLLAHRDGSDRRSASSATSSWARSSPSPRPTRSTC